MKHIVFVFPNGLVSQALNHANHLSRGRLEIIGQDCILKSWYGEPNHQTNEYDHHDQFYQRIAF